MYNTNTPANAPQGSFYVVEITSTAIPKYYDGTYDDVYNYRILEMSCRCNIINKYNIIGSLSTYYAKPYIRFISVHSIDSKVSFSSDLPSLLLYPYLRSDNTGYINSYETVSFAGGSLIEIPRMHCGTLVIGSGKYTSLPKPDEETGEKLVYNSIRIDKLIDGNGFAVPSALDVLPIPDAGISYENITMQPNSSPLDCLTIADLSQLSVDYQSGGQENYSSNI